MDVEAFKREWQNNYDYIEAYTSGSTGKPKCIHLKKNFVRASALRTIKYFSITPSDRLHLPLSCDYIAGKMMVVRSIISGAKLTWEQASNKVLEQNRNNEVIKLLSVVPSQIPWIIEHKSHLPEIKNLLVGGSAIPPHIRKLLCDSGINAYESYGMTETASHVAIRVVNNNPHQLYEMLPGCECSIDARGCLIITIGDERFITNDLAEIIEPGKFKLYGRVDNIINSGGIKYQIEDIEQEIDSILSKHSLSITFYVCGRKSELWGEEIVMVVEGQKKDYPEIRDILLAKMNHKRIPKEIIYHTRLPRTHSGKLIRKLI